MSFLLNDIPANPAIDRFIELSFEMSERIIRLLSEKGMTQRDLANLLGKKDSEISKWLQGSHNLTLRTIAAIEVALGENFVKVTGLDSSTTTSVGSEQVATYYVHRTEVVSVSLSQNLPNKQAQLHPYTIPLEL